MKNREIKFRAWDNELKRFDNVSAGNLLRDLHDEGVSSEDKERYTLNQYIGVKGYVGDYKKRHQNEVMLFEGDIVEAMSEGAKGTFVIKFRQDSQPTFILYPAWQSKKLWSIAASDLGRKKGDYYDDLRLIGNIHENPELLNA